jgi:hypothetical protein
MQEADMTVLEAVCESNAHLSMVLSELKALNAQVAVLVAAFGPVKIEVTNNMSMQELSRPEVWLRP